MHGAPLPCAQRWRPHRASRMRCAGARPAPGSSAPALPAAHQRRRRHPAGRSGAEDARRCSWASNRASSATRPARTRSRSPPGPFAERHDDARQLHAPAPRQLVRDLSQRERVARMYAPQIDARAGRAIHHRRRPATRAGSSQAISRYGVIGHAQTSARARRNGKPLILRRDFNTDRRRPGRPALRLAAAHDRRLRHGPATR